MTASGLPLDVATTGTGENSSRKVNESDELAARCAMTRRSSLWAAYGDALGWISELTDSTGLKRRTGGAPLCRPMAWTRRIGGRAGITTSLPQGCYSDDSQLRLATSRAIGPDGFDVEAFAKVELPVWLSYGLGGGKSTNAAAANLAKPMVPWFANTFKGWSNSGGNGAAMRVQPHVWATRALDDAKGFLPDVVRNSICTHSHPVGLLGSVLHALTLAHTMVTGRHPSVDDLLAATETASYLPEIIRNDIEVGSYWRATFERESGPFGDAWNCAIEECREAVRIAGTSASNKQAAERYAALVEGLKLRDPARRGSGMLTAIASVGLLWCEPAPEEAMRIAANELGTDTDTIATMAGALLGATADAEPPIDVLDAELFRSEADRLTKIAHGGKPERHRYPDLLRWTAPSRRADTLVRTRDGDLYVRGLGPAKVVSDSESSSRGEFQWQWLALESGQTLLIKRRTKLMCVNEDTESLPAQRTLASMSSNGDELQRPSQTDRPAAEARPPVAPTPHEAPDAISERPPSLDLQRALEYMAEHKDDDRVLGAALRRVVSKGTPGQIAAFTAALIDELQRTEKTRQARRG